MDSIAIDRELAESIGPISKRWSVAHIVAAATALLFATGLLLESVSIAGQGFAAPISIRPRLLLVGFAYYAYLGLPLLLTIGVWQSSVFILHGERPRFVRISTYVCCAFAMVAAIRFIRLPLHYFVTGAWFLGDIWWLYMHPWSWTQWLFIYCPAWWYIANSRASAPVLTREIDAIIRRICIVLIPIGIVCSFMGYIGWVYYNISYAVGGGQPAVVEVMIRVDSIDAIDPDKYYRQVPFESMDERVSHEWTLGPLLVWHASDEFLYVSPIAQFRRHVLTSAIPKRSILAMHHLSSRVLFSRGQPKTVFSEWGVPEEVPMMDWEIPMRRLNEFANDRIQEIKDRIQGTETKTVQDAAETDEEER